MSFYVKESSQLEKALPCRERPIGLRVFMVDDRPFTAAHGGLWYGRYKSVRKGQPKQLQPLKSQNKSGHGKSVHGNEVMY